MSQDMEPQSQEENMTNLLEQIRLRREERRLQQQLNEARQVAEEIMPGSRTGPSAGEFAGDALVEDARSAADEQMRAVEAAHRAEQHRQYQELHQAMLEGSGMTIVQRGEEAPQVNEEETRNLNGVLRELYGAGLLGDVSRGTPVLEMTRRIEERDALRERPFSHARRQRTVHIDLSPRPRQEKPSEPVINLAEEGSRRIRVHGRKRKEEAPVV